MAGWWARRRSAGRLVEPAELLDALPLAGGVVHLEVRLGHHGGARSGVGGRQPVGRLGQLDGDHVPQVRARVIWRVEGHRLAVRRGTRDRAAGTRGGIASWGTDDVKRSK